MSFDLRPCTIDEVANLVERYHGYGSMGALATYTFGVFEDARIVAAYAWQPPPYGAARAVCPEAPSGVLALSRMVAVPRAERRLRHVSKPLRVQMRRKVDRGRWPVLCTYSDEGEGHTGHVYKCSGWQQTARVKRRFYVDAAGARMSSYANGVSGGRGLVFGGYTFLQRWEHWVCDRGAAALYMERNGWVREPRPGRVWRSGNQAFTWTRRVEMG